MYTVKDSLVLSCQLGVLVNVLHSDLSERNEEILRIYWGYIFIYSIL